MKSYRILIFFFFHVGGLNSQSSSSFTLAEIDFQTRDSVRFFVKRSLDSNSYISLTGKYELKSDTLWIQALTCEKKRYTYFFLESYKPQKNFPQSMAEIYLEFTYINAFGGVQHRICDFDFQIDSMKFNYDCYPTSPLVFKKTQLKTIKIDDFPLSIELENSNSNEVEIIVQMSVAPMEVEILPHMIYKGRMITVIVEE